MELPPSARSPIQRRKEERKLLENRAAFAVISKALDNRDTCAVISSQTTETHSYTHRNILFKSRSLEESNSN